jgi:hypothetical protein
MVQALPSFRPQNSQKYSGNAQDGIPTPLEESPPLPLRPIRDGHFTTGQGFVTFLNPSADGRMEHLAHVCGQRS